MTAHPRNIAQTDKPTTALPAAWRRFTPRLISERVANPMRLLREVGIIAVAYFTYFGVRAMTAGELNHALSNSLAIVEFEAALGLFLEPTVQATVVGYHWAVNLANWIYLFGHWPIVIAVGIWLYRRDWSRYRLYRNALILSGAIGLVIFMVYPVAPPRLLASLFVDTVTKHSNLYHVLQPIWLTNQIAALPSLHFGWNLLVGIVLVREAKHPASRLFGLIMPIVMLVAIVATANHYLLDAFVGGGGAIIGLVLATKLSRR